MSVSPTWHRAGMYEDTAIFESSIQPLPFSANGGRCGGRVWSPQLASRGRYTDRQIAKGRNGRHGDGGEYEGHCMETGFKLA